MSEREPLRAKKKGLKLSNWVFREATINSHPLGEKEVVHKKIFQDGNLQRDANGASTVITQRSFTRKCIS